MSAERKTIRFEDLGEPVQKLLRALHKGNGVTDEDMALLEYIGVKDMVKIYQEMGSTDDRAQEIWDELKTALIARREKADRKRRELDERVKDLESERAAAEAETQRLADEQAEEEAAAEKRRRKKEKRERRAAEAAAAAEEEERARLEAEAAAAAEEEAAREAEEEEKRRRREERRKRREAKAAQLAEEQAALEQEQAAARDDRRRKRDQKKEWSDYVASHPLEFNAGAAAPAAQLEQKGKLHDALGRTALADDSLLNRIYTAQCGNCHAKYSKPPHEWDCPMCLRKFRQHVKCWQPDDATNCGVCNCSVGRFTRHHCRSCGRVVCGKCSEFKVEIPAIGFKGTPVRACRQCVAQLAPHVLEAAAAAKK